MRNERIVISRQRLLDEVWGYDPFSTTNTIEVFVSNLRRKLEAGERAAAAPHDPRSRLRPPRLRRRRRRAGAARTRLRRDAAGRRRTPLSHLPIRVRLATGVAIVAFAILAIFAVAVGTLTAHRLRVDLQRPASARRAQYVAGAFAARRSSSAAADSRSATSTTHRRLRRRHGAHLHAHRRGHVPEPGAPPLGARSTPGCTRAARYRVDSVRGVVRRRRRALVSTSSSGSRSPRSQREIGNLELLLALGVLVGTDPRLRRRRARRAARDRADRRADRGRRARSSAPATRAARCPSRPPTTRSPSSRARCAGCSTRSPRRATRPRRRSSASARSSPTPRTSCARR